MFRLVTISSVMGCIVALLFDVEINLYVLHSAEPKPAKVARTAVLAGGCFWCTEAAFEHCPGVIDVLSGYSGGTTENPNYSTYHDGHHSECNLITYDPKKITFGGLVEWLVKHIDPTDANGQFKDRGDGYKPIVFYDSDADKDAAQIVFNTIDERKIFDSTIQIELRKHAKFWPAEAHHQNFYKTQKVAYTGLEEDSGRKEFFRKHWGKKANILELPGSIPKGVVSKGVVTKDSK